MSRYGTFTRIARDQRSLATAYWKTSAEGGSILLEDATFVVGSASIGVIDPDVELVLGDGACLEVRDGLTPNVQLTVPDGYVEALEQSSMGGLSRRLYWSSATPPRGLDDPSQSSHGGGDLTLYVPESLEPAYRKIGFSKWGSPSRRYLDVWDYEPSASPTSSETGAERSGEAVESPGHYTWLGQSLAALGLSDASNVESWDVLDAAFPSDPLLWNCGKYLLRQGRKGGEEKRLEDLRKARQYLDRQITQLSRGGE